MKKKLLITFTIILSFCFNFTTYAQAQNIQNISYLSYENEYINIFAKSILKSDYPAATYYLKDLNNSNRYIFFDYLENGYIVYDSLTSSITEASPTSLKFKNEIATEDIYYTGPLSYYKIEDNNYYNLITNQTTKKEVLNNQFIELNNNLDTINKVILRGNSEYSISISGSIPNYSYNPNGICGSTAAAMWLRYMDIYKSNNYVPSYLESSNGISLIKYLTPYIDGSVPGSTATDLLHGLQEYINQQGINKQLSLYSWNASKFKQAISQNIPVLLDLDKEPTYNEHWVVASGYYVYQSPGISFVIVNDGWGSTGVYINPSYIGRFIY